MWYHSDFKLKYLVHVGCLGILQNINVFTSSIIKTFFANMCIAKNFVIKTTN